MITLPVILLKWYSENHLDTLHLRASLFLSAASKLATVGMSKLDSSMCGDCRGDPLIPLVSFRSGKGSESSMMLARSDCSGGETDLSMRK